VRTKLYFSNKQLQIFAEEIRFTGAHDFDSIREFAENERFLFPNSVLLEDERPAGTTFSDRLKSWFTKPLLRYDHAMGDVGASAAVHSNNVRFLKYGTEPYF